MPPAAASCLALAEPSINIMSPAPPPSLTCDVTPDVNFRAEDARRYEARATQHSDRRADFRRW
jgi:hypothetical protein